MNLVPKEEMRNKFYSHINHVSNTKSVSRLNLIMFYSDSLTKVRGIMARYICASVHKDKRSILGKFTMVSKPIYLG